MRTSKPISTISYNSFEFLNGKLHELAKAHTISDFCFIKHFAEEDENKDHFHVWICPNRLIDTMDLQEFFHEFDPSHPDKPLGCIDFRSSSTDDFILYSMHLEAYLIAKGESRKYHYVKEDFHFYDSDNFDFIYNHALKGSTFAMHQQRVQLLNETDNYEELILTGAMPLGMACHLSSLQNMKRKNHTYRNGRLGHELPSDSPVKVNMETGEILDASFDKDDSLEF